mmetsp:Transcript_29954/g.45124  ORF Transcript_29954/g.45124 Transcript_29954/m.45124 type:complete len:130 (-) Transcript_29954:69-458(-)|eukprot:CAMPEP_0194748838 /NCGR_PEP_ID=MMETSP0323_2-20130528/3016_1 /TAXON_ID=2866 ORGANISM="Crypthecodinium cohnii, Strain Seligo" /NCGR_SAMPLE_ID=MMETSP0323_2 /ASSEMBLY_ACC=CAM_ASM_000346 /LENGTH=129 /DNA_ID=CAMNT_0039663453 /DNA_START=88 /DNA_END=477 /DNA_ORIENTATION=-
MARSNQSLSSGEFHCSGLSPAPGSLALHGFLSVAIAIAIFWFAQLLWQAPLGFGLGEPKSAVGGVVSAPSRTRSAACSSGDYGLCGVKEDLRTLLSFFFGSAIPFLLCGQSRRSCRIGADVANVVAYFL